MTITDSKGVFLISRIRDTLVTTEISYLGYKNYIQKIKVDLKKGTNLDTIALGTTAYTLDAAVVQGERPLMRMSGDTLIFNTESIPVLPGDETMELIMRLPGFDTEDGIKVSGKTVERTYVDGKPLFGEDAQTALKYLEAREVVDIQVYEELIEEDKIKGFENGRKRTVMNLITRSKPNRSINLRASAGYGADIDPNAEGKHNSRYRANAGYHMFTEEKRFNINAGTNNSSRGSGGYNKSTNASIGFSRTWNKKLFFNGNYNFNDQYNRTQSISRGVHPDWAVKFGRWWSGRSRKSHGGESDRSVTEPLIAYARDRQRIDPVDYYIFGHMHYARDYAADGLRVVLLGAWDWGYLCFF